MKRVVPLVVMACLLFVLHSPGAHSQLTWERNPGNPVIPAWAGGGYTLSPSVMFDSTSGVYRMWFSGVSGGLWRISYALSADGLDWCLSINSTTTLTGSPLPFEVAGVSHATVIRDNVGFKMYYSGISQAGRGSIGVATSSDGIHWTKHSGNPILTNSANPWESFDVGWPNVYFDGSSYKMWYHGYDGSYYRTGLATSTDGIVWTKHPSNPVLDRGGTGSWDEGAAMVNSFFVAQGTYYLFYEGSHPQPNKIGFATSSDGVTWTKFSGNPVFFGSTSGWDVSTYRGSMTQRNSQVQYWYSGYSPSGGWQIGYATSPFTPLDVPERESVVPREFTLYQAYPNPFNPETTIEYSLPRETHVTIKVFDALGQEVTTLVDNHMVAGTHSVRWNSAGAASGVYLYRMTSGDFSEAKKIVLMK